LTVPKPTEEAPAVAAEPHIAESTDDDDSTYRIAEPPPKPAPPPKRKHPGAFSGGAPEKLSDAARGTFDSGPVAPQRKKKRKKVVAYSDNPRFEPRMWFFALTLLPLLIFSLLPARSDKERLKDFADGKPIPALGADEADDPKLPDGPVLDDDELVVDGNMLRKVVKQFPDSRLPGAHLAVDSYVHWAYAALATLVFLGAVAILFPTGGATALQLVGIGLLTGTVGIGLLLGFQMMSFALLRIQVIGRSILVIIIWICQLIAWSYLLSFNSEGDFFAQWIGFTFGVGLCEELVKALPLIVGVASTSRDLDWRSLRAWGLASGVGFGVSEAIHYCGAHYNGFAGWDMYVVRFVSCVGFHAILAAGTALLFYNNSDEIVGGEFWSSAWNVVLFMMPAMVMHGLYNTLVSRDYNLAAFFVGCASFLWLAWLSGRTQAEAD
jgi:RsiW-degrading membrane proteinase PrsW (M82 family)